VVPDAIQRRRLARRVEEHLVFARTVMLSRDLGFLRDFEVFDLKFV
jgi:hypothetical protein